VPFRGRILVVDDNENVLSIMSDFLASGYVVDAASSAAAALKAVGTAAPDAILLDINMPGTDGVSLLGSLRRLGVTVPVFVITGYDAPHIGDQVRQLGAQYLVKPVDLRTLDRLISTALHVTPILPS
jgi:two-component system response regulator PrrA